MNKISNTLIIIENGQLSTYSLDDKLSWEVGRPSKDNFPDIKYAVEDYKELLNKDDIDAVYCAVPHNLHEQFYVDIITTISEIDSRLDYG